MRPQCASHVVSLGQCANHKLCTRALWGQGPAPKAGVSSVQTLVVLCPDFSFVKEKVFYHFCGPLLTIKFHFRAPQLSKPFELTLDNFSCGFSDVALVNRSV